MKNSDAAAIAEYNKRANLEERILQNEIKIQFPNAKFENGKWYYDSVVLVNTECSWLPVLKVEGYDYEVLCESDVGKFLLNKDKIDAKNRAWEKTWKKVRIVLWIVAAVVISIISTILYLTFSL